MCLYLFIYGLIYSPINGQRGYFHMCHFVLYYSNQILTHISVCRVQMLDYSILTPSNLIVPNFTPMWLNQIPFLLAVYEHSFFLHVLI